MTITDIFDALNFNYTGLYLEPDGTFPNHHPDPSVEKNLADVKAALEKDGYIVETFIDSRLAKERIEQNKFDIVVTDLKMANIDGMQLFQFVKQKYPDTEVILISGFATLDVVKNGLQAGVRVDLPLFDRAFGPNALS